MIKIHKNEIAKVIICSYFKSVLKSIKESKMIDTKKLKPRYITDENGKKLEVILPINVFLELIEDLQDLAVRAERKNEESISHQQLLEELKLNGLI